MIKKIITLAKGSLIAQATTFLSGILLAKIYPPNDFGRLGVYVSLYAVLSGIYCLKLDQSIMVQKSRVKVGNVLSLSILVSVIILLFLLILWGVFAFFGKSTLFNNYKYLIFCVIISGFLYSWILIGHQLLIRDEQFSRSAIAKMMLPLLASFFQVILYFVGDNDGLMTGQLIALCIVVIVLFYDKYEILFNGFINRTNVILLSHSVRRNVSFPLYVLPNYLFNTLSVNMPTLLFSTYYGMNVSGNYMVSQRLIASPMSIFTGPVFQVFYQEAAISYRNKNNIYPLINKVFLNQVKIGLLPFALIMIFSPWIFEYTLGSVWRDAGTYSSILSVWLFMVFVNSPLTSVINIINAQKFYFMFEVLGFVVRLASILVAFKFSDNPIYAVISFTIAGVLINLVLTYLILFKFRKYYNV